MDMRELDSGIKAWLEENPLEGGTEFSNQGQIKIFSEDDTERPLVYGGEDAYKIVQSEASAKAFIELFDDPSSYTVETHKINLKPDVLLAFNDAFSYVEEMA